jgi:hypothetical protein
MGLNIKATPEKGIKIIGADITLEGVYGRIEFAGRANGKTLEIAIATYASKEAFEASASAMSTDVQQGSFTVDIQTTESQSIETAHEYAKLAYEQLGYEVIINI